ncbi:MAG: FAD-dependent oxidoreductase, partial [Armatimonadetes bacterium]|nr:FAD-dependent oxidoreductase [Armatimonadota bacterium]
MQPFIIEPERALPVWGEYEVVVVGGGMAGTAAVAAARHGARVCLVEKESAPGGLATLGNVVMYLFLCDGVGRRVVGGLGEEMLRLACREGAARLPECWQPGGDVQERRRTRYMATFAPAACLLALEAFILENGVDLWYDTRFCAAIREGRRIRALCVENKSGRGALLCKTVVDASGDADVCHQAGEETVSSRANVACGWIHAFDGSALTLHPLTRPFAADPEASGEDGFAGHTGSGVTAQILASRRLIRGHLEALRRPSPDSPLIPAYVPTIATVRMTRRLKGRRELRIGDAGRFLMTLSASPATKQPVGVRVQFSFRPGGRGERFVRPENGPTGRAGDHKDRPYR